MRFWILIISTLLASSLSGQVDLSASIDTSHIRIGEQATIQLEVSFNQGRPQVTWPEVKDTLTRAIEVIDPGVIDTFHVGDRTRQIQEVIITAWDSGFYAIPPFQFTIDGQQRETEAFLLSVTTMHVDTTAAPMDIKPIQEEPFSINDWLSQNYIYLVSLAILAVLIYFIVRANKKEEKPTRVLIQRKHVPPHVTALSELREMKKEERWQNETSKAYFTMVTDILRDYIEKNYGIPAREQTTSEIIEQLKYVPMQDTDKRSLSSILMRADMAKFAKEKSSEVASITALDHAITFIENTSPPEVQDDK